MFLTDDPGGGGRLGSLDSWLSKALRKVEKEVIRPVAHTIREAAEDVEQEVIRPVAHTIREAAEDIEQEIIRPVVHEALPYIAAASNIIPGVGQGVSAFLFTAAGAREAYVQQQQTKEVDKMLSDVDKLLASAGAPSTTNQLLADQYVVEEVKPSNKNKLIVGGIIVALVIAAQIGKGR